MRQHFIAFDVSRGTQNERVLFIGEAVALNFLEIGDDRFHWLVFLRGIEAEQAFQGEIVVQFRLLFGGEFIERLNGGGVTPIGKGADGTVLNILVRALQIRKDGVHGLFAADGRENLLEGDAVFSSHVAQGADKAFNRFRIGSAKIREGVLEAA